MNTLRIFNHYVHVKFLMLGAVQFLCLVLSVYLAVKLRFLGQDAQLASSFSVLLPKAAIFALAIQLCAGAMGLYRVQRETLGAPLIVRLVAAFVVAFLPLAMVFYLIPGLFLGRGVLALATLIALFIMLVIQLGFYLLVDQRTTAWRVLFYGASCNASSLLAFMRRRSDQTMFRLVGCVEVADEGVAVDPDLVVNPDSTLAAYALEHGIDEIVVAMDDRRRHFPADELIDCRIAGVNVIDTVTFYERQNGKVKADLLSPGWIIFSDGFRRSSLQHSIKRVLEILASALMLLVLSPVIIATAAAVAIEGRFREPVLFSQQRVGRHGRHFTILKFRSMRTDAEADGEAIWASKADPRITRVGGSIRKYRLDELPQLLNVLKGDMSLVGPRPERPEFVVQLARNLPYYRVRECVKPGITGWAQLGYPYGASEEDARGKLELDLYYVKNFSLFLDLLILIGTCEVVLFRRGSR